MKHQHLLAKVFLFLILLVYCELAHAYSLRQYSSKNGLSNSAILSMCQDENGFVWFGSCDGLNMFDGINFQIYKSTNDRNNLSGNLIETIIETGNHIMWVQTNYGLDRFDSRKRTIHTYKEFKGRNKLFQSSHHELYIVKEDNYLYYYEPADEAFYRIYIDNLICEDILEIAIDATNTLWIFSTGGKYRSYTLNRDEQGVSLEPRNYFNHDNEVLWCFFDDNIFYFVDSTYTLYEYDALTRQKKYIHDISMEVSKYGDISSILKHHDDYFIGFKSSGLIVLQSTPKLKTRFKVNEIDIKSGIFCLMKDRFQDIIWVGTDGQGVFMYFVSQHTIKSTLFPSMEYPVNNPVRALFIDKERSLWVGTKGDGIIKVPSYNIATNTGGSSEHILSSNSALKNNSVYAFAESKKNILWIGSENGINYYSYKDGQIKDIPLIINNKPVKYVHSICEFNDSTLWIATVGEGIVKARLTGTADNPVLAEGQRFVYNDGKSASNYFFTSYKENDSIIWFGNRGYGAYRMNNNTHEVSTVIFDDSETNQTLNDIFTITKTNEGYWFGTSYGLAHLRGGEKMIFNETNGLPNNTIHGILADNNNNLWLSTNQGIVQLNTTQNTFRTYNQPNELAVTEFSDGAHFKDPLTNILLFGGVNGYISIIENDNPESQYKPGIHFNQLSIFGKEYNIHDFTKIYQGKEGLQLKYSQNFFSVSFTAIDYIHGNDYTYYYKLKELSENWIENGSSNQASFTNISPGNYTLQVKYRNNITGEESDLQSLYIRILAPWYQTNLAYFVYTLFFLLIVVVIGRFALNWYRLKQSNIMEKLNVQQREEIYESKLRFFTNITHELCTPLTLISGPCEKIISYPGTDQYISRYASLIKINAEKLNNLIQELIEFRRLETGNKKVNITQLSVSELTNNVADSFVEYAESKGYQYTMNIANDIIWNSDGSCLSKVITNLISNAFKYTSDNGIISVELFVKNNKLYIAISNTGKGIKEENISKIFDRYTILDSLEEQSKKGDSPRNGLGLAICNHMVKLLDGEIQVKSVLNEVTTFTVILPDLPITEHVSREEILLRQIAASSVAIPEVTPEFIANTTVKVDKTQQTIMIVDDDAPMLWFISQVFIEKYNVIPINNPNEVLPFLKKELPDLIISDIMMPDIDGVSLLKMIKEDKLLKHIPLILLSAKNNPEEKVRGIDSGAEAYITKPFNIEYLEKVVARLLKRKEELKEYYTSSLSAFEMVEGKLTHLEDKEFFDKMLKVIEENISNPDLSADILSSSLGVSTRQLYRKAKEITLRTPNDIIKEQRLLMVERLLITSNHSVDEIMYKTGFNNRGHFFKVFAQRFGTTPKSYREQKKSEALE